MISDFSDSDFESGATFTPEPGTDPDPDDTKDESSSSDAEEAQIFAPDEDRKPQIGQFLVLGVFSGRTRNSVVKLMDDYGA